MQEPLDPLTIEFPQKVVVTKEVYPNTPLDSILKLRDRMRNYALIQAGAIILDPLVSNGRLFRFSFEQSQKSMVEQGTVKLITRIHIDAVDDNE